MYMITRLRVLIVEYENGSRLTYFYITIKFMYIITYTSVYTRDQNREKSCRQAILIVFRLLMLIKQKNSLAQQQYLKYIAQGQKHVTLQIYDLNSTADRDKNSRKSKELSLV